MINYVTDGKKWINDQNMRRKITDYEKKNYMRITVEVLIIIE